MKLPSDKHAQCCPSSDNAGDNLIRFLQLSTGLAAKQELLSVDAFASNGSVPMVSRSLSP